jgi:hypothetical protein
VVLELDLGLQEYKLYRCLYSDYASALIESITDRDLVLLGLKRKLGVFIRYSHGYILGKEDTSSSKGRNNTNYIKILVAANASLYFEMNKSLARSLQ